MRKEPFTGREGMRAFYLLLVTLSVCVWWVLAVSPPVHLLGGRGLGGKLYEIKVILSAGEVCSYRTIKSLRQGPCH